MYLGGSPGTLKDRALTLLEGWLVNKERLVTSVEVLQEILHRYGAVGRKDAIQPAFETILGIVQEVYAIELRDIERAKDILMGTEKLSARDALHLAVMERRGISRIASFDRGFEGYPGVTRLF